MYTQILVTKCQNGGKSHESSVKITEKSQVFCRFRQKHLTLFFLFTFSMEVNYKKSIMGKKYNCIEGSELGHLGGAWFASYVAYDINLRYSGLATLPVNSMNWQKRTG